MSPSHANLEADIARAHKAIWFAQHHAIALGYEGLAEDLQQLLVEFTRLQTDLLRTGRPRRLAVGPPQGTLNV